MIICDRCNLERLNVKNHDFLNPVAGGNITVQLCSECLDYIQHERYKTLRANIKQGHGTAIQYSLPPEPTTFWIWPGLVRIGLAGMLAGIISFGTLLGLQWLMHHIH